MWAASQVAAINTPSTASLVTYPAIGRHFYAWLEFADAGTTTWIGDTGAPTTYQTGISGVIHG